MISSNYSKIKEGFSGIEKYYFDQSRVDSTLAGNAVASSKKVNGEDHVILKTIRSNFVPVWVLQFRFS